MRRRGLGLTRRGWTVAGAAAGLLVGGRLLGADELLVLGVAALVVLLGALLWVASTRPRLDVARKVRPARLHVGDPGRADLTVTARRATPLVEFVETIDGGRLRARFLLAPLAAGAVATPAYRVPTDQRGPLSLGPTAAVRSDPLGLAQRSRVVAPAETVLVRPRVHAVAPPPVGGGRRPAVDEVESPRAPATSAGTELLAVRPYEVGDDPRRVHWRATARVGELMVRQFVAPRRGHTLVVLDTRAPGGGEEPTDAAFERAVEATASIVAALLRVRRPFECVTSGGTVLAQPGGDPQRAFDRLATVMRDEEDLLDALARTRRTRPPELVLLVTSRGDARVEAARHLLGRRTGTMLVVTGGRLHHPRGDVADGVVDARTVPFADAWRRAIGAARARARPRPQPLTVVR